MARMTEKRKVSFVVERRKRRGIIESSKGFLFSSFFLFMCFVVKTKIEIVDESETERERVGREEGESGVVCH